MEIKQSRHSHVHQHTPDRLENPDRVRELNPAATLHQIGFAEGQVLCDIGAGSGLFTLPAARISSQKIYALDINPVMLKAIQVKAEAESLKNIALHQVEGDVLPVPDSSADLALVATVLHEIPEKAPFIREIHRLLKPDGRLAVIEFHARITPFGPPPSERLSQVDVITQLETHGLMLQDKFDLGANFYCAIFGKS